MAQVGPTGTKPFLKPPQSFHKSIKPFTIAANCLGLLPVYGNTSNSIEDLSFRWISLKTLFSFLVLLQAFCTSVLHLIPLFTNGMSCNLLMSFWGYFVWLLQLVAYFYSASKWRKLIKKWYEVDFAMQRVYGYPERLNVRFKIIGTVAFFLAAFYIVLDFPIENQRILEHFDYIFAFIDGQYINDQLLIRLIQIDFFFSVVSWAFNDTFVILISTALALRFKQVADRVLKYGSNMQSLEFWSAVRTDYIRLFQLCQLVNKYLAFHITLSFACNTFYLLLDLFFIIKYGNKQESEVVGLYCIDSFCCILTITCTTFYTAWVNDESKRFADALKNIPSENHNLAIELLMEQIPFNPVALSGNNIFQCTRGLILNIIGAAITYELLLIQFSDAVISR